MLLSPVGYNPPIFANLYVDLSQARRRKWGETRREGGENRTPSTANRFMRPFIVGIMGGMQPAEILALYDQDMRRNVEFADMRREETPFVVRYLRPAPGMSFILYSRLDADNADNVIESEKAYFMGRGQPLEWKVFSHDAPPDLGERLLAHGFSADEPGAIMVLDLENAPAGLLQPVEQDLRRLTHRGQLEDVIAVMQPVWGDNFDWMHQRLGSHMEIPGYLSVYVAYVDHLPVSAAWTYFYPNNRFASLWGGSTLPQYRRRGFYTALLAARTREALQRGYRFLTVECSPMSQPIVASHGFICLTHATSYNWQP